MTNDTNHFATCADHERPQTVQSESSTSQHSTSDHASDFHCVHSACNAFTASTVEVGKTLIEPISQQLRFVQSFIYSDVSLEGPQRPPAA